MKRALLWALIAVVAAAQAGNFAGSYYLRNVREAGSELLLRPDGTFQFEFAYGAADYSARGTWKAQGNAVILNTPALKNAAPFRLLRSATIPEPALLVHLQAPNGRGVPNIDVVLTTANGPVKGRTDSSGDAEFPKDSPASGVAFTIPVYALETQPIPVNSAHQEFVFEINGEAIATLQFKDERVEVSGKTLILRHWPGSEMRYEKGQ